MNLLTGASLLARAKSIYYSQTLFYGHPLNTDTSLLWTVCFVPGEKTPYIFSKFNPLNTDTSLLWTISTDPSMSVLTGFDCSLYEWLNEMQPPQ